MKILVDTHVLLWSLLDPEKLPAAALATLVAAGTQVWLSPITTWECLMLAEKNRVELLPDATTWIRDAIARIRAREAPLNHEVAIASRKLTLAHQDPADRFLVATALVYGLTLATADKRLLAAPDYPVLNCRT